MQGGIWDPLPTALKLQEIEKEFEHRNNRTPTELELAGLASLTRGEVRRLKKLLGLPEEYRQELLDELEKPRSKQQITVDHVLEATKGASALRKRGLIESEDEEDQLRKAILQKFRSGVVKNTVAPRKLARLARGFERGEVPRETARSAVRRLITDDSYSIGDAFSQSVEQVDYEHTVEQLVARVIDRLDVHERRGYQASSDLRKALEDLIRKIQDFLE